MHLSLEFNEWTEAAIEEGVFKKWIFFKMTVLRVSRWLHDQNLSNIPVKRFNFSKVADLKPATLIRTRHFYRHILIRLALI